MKTLKILPSFSLLLVMLLSVGCGRSGIEGRTPSPIVSAAPTETTKPTLTVAPLTPTLTPTPIRTNTPTAIPTLAVEQARARVSELLANNGGCRLPCLWGITPGISSYQEARTILKPLISISRFEHFDFASPDNIYIEYTDGDFTTNTFIAYHYSDNDIVSSIGVRVSATQENPDGFIGIYDSKIFGRRASAYMLPHILSEQGKPEAVLISTDGGRARGKNVPGFYLWLFYPDQGLLVSYTTYRQLVNGKVRGCLANAHVDLQLFPAGQPDTFAKNLAQTDKWKDLWPVPVDSTDWWKPIEEATSMTLDQFYETFRQPTNKCIETPANLWYIPER